MHVFDSELCFMWGQFLDLSQLNITFLTWDKLNEVLSVFISLHSAQIKCFLSLGVEQWLSGGLITSQQEGLHVIPLFALVFSEFLPRVLKNASWVKWKL